MYKPRCYYLVLARTALPNPVTGEIDFKAFEKRFYNKDPILAREHAFAFRNKFIYGMLVAIGIHDDIIRWNNETSKIEGLTDREIRKLINPYLEPESKSPKTILRTSENKEIEIEWKAPYDTWGVYPHFNNGIWIIMRHNDTELHEEFMISEDDELVIDKLTRFEEPLPTPPNYENLIEEYKFYKNHGFDTKSYETSVTFFDKDQFLEDGMDEEQSIINFDCLSTHFDWSDYDSFYWWDPQEGIDFIIKEEQEKEELNKRTTFSLSMEDAINGGETHFCEFKPHLLNKYFANRDIEFEVVKTICAFLNTKGGYLFIGISDERKLLGLDFTDISKDYFLREFTRIKSRFFPPYIAHSINGEFYSDSTEIEKEVFAITVYPSNEPVFIRIKDNENNKLIRKEFYIRSDASSRNLYDIEDMVKYCRDKWYSKAN